MSTAKLTRDERRALEFAVCEDLTHTYTEGHDGCEQAMITVAATVERILAAHTPTPRPVAAEQTTPGTGGA